MIQMMMHYYHELVVILNWTYDEYMVFSKQKPMVKIVWTLLILLPLLSILLLVPLYYLYKPLVIFPLIEIFHFLYYLALKIHINGLQYTKSLKLIRRAMPSVQRRLCWLKAIDVAETYDFQKWIKGWFSNTPLNDISRDDVSRFVSFVALGANDEVYETETSELSQYLTVIENRLTATTSSKHSTHTPIYSASPGDGDSSYVHSGANHKHKGRSDIRRGSIFAPTLKAINSIYHPFVYYLMVYWSTYSYKRYLFRKKQFVDAVYSNAHNIEAYVAGCRVFYRPATAAATSSSSSSAGSTQPIIFFHGMGAGLAPYSKFIDTLIEVYGATRPIFLLYIPHISMTHQRHLPALTDISALVDDAVVNTLRSAGNTEMVLLDLISHSFGTCLASNLLQRQHTHDSSIVFNNVTMVEPAAISCCLPDMICRLYFDTNYAGIFDLLVRTEIHTMYAVQRRLDWMESFIGGLGNIVISKGPRKASSSSKIRQDYYADTFTHLRKYKVFLSKADVLVPLDPCIRALTRLAPDADLEFFPGTHGGWMPDAQSRLAVVMSIMET